MLGKGASEPLRGVDLQPSRERRPLRGDLRHELVDILQLLQRRPGGVALAPVRARREPYGEGFREILVGMALRVPQPQMPHVAAAAWIGRVMPRIGSG